ncbi:HET-domain-containing protein, partial [Lentithecium fluviatile CBS 122367]
VDHDALSPKNIESWKEWISDCLSNRDLCQHGAGQYLPTRLLEVGEEVISGTDPEARVIITADEISRGSIPPSELRYAVLSYCWGDTARFPALRTTDDEIYERMRGIRRPDIPQTIFDAIVVTKALGLRYLWIDALWIIQGNDEDWERQSVKLMDVYGN